MGYKNCPPGCGEPKEENCKGCYSWEVEHESHIKPPIGIEPHKIWVENRIAEIISAMDRYTRSCCVIPAEWVYEYNALIEEINIK